MHGVKFGTPSIRRVVEAGDLLAEHLRVRGREARAAVLLRHDDTGEAGIEEHALHTALTGELGQFLLVRPLPEAETRRHRRQVLADPRTCPLAEAVEVLDVVGCDVGRRHAAASSCSSAAVRRSRCSRDRAVLHRIDRDPPQDRGAGRARR